MERKDETYMIGIADYLELIYRDFRKEIDVGRCLCDLKGLTFEANHLPNYNNPQIQRLYLLRYAYAYGFEYAHIYSVALEKLGNPHQLLVTSIGCGNYLDYWALVLAIEKKKKECSIRYVGIDEVDWNYKVEKRGQDELHFKQGNAVEFFAENKEFISDIYFFPKSISEFNDEEMHIITDSFRHKPVIKDKIMLCFSIRANKYSREMDMYKTLQIVRALEENGYRQNGDKNVSWSFVENKAISLIDNTYRYPTVVYDYVTKLNEKCNNYIYMRANCGCECEKLNRKPATKTGNMIYQIIELERVNKK